MMTLAQTLEVEAARAAKAKQVPLPWVGARLPIELSLASACTRCGAPRGMSCVRAVHEELWNRAP